MKKNAFKLLSSLLFMLLQLHSYGCNKNDIITTMIDTTTNHLSYLALGDSYTIGEAVAENERFPAQTVHLLKANNINISNLQYIATTGWTTANLAAAINTQQPKGPFNIVTLLIGVNDQYQGMGIEGYKTRFTQLLQTAIHLSGNKPNHVFVLSIPDYSVTPFAASSDTAQISREIAAFNAANKAITATFTGVSYIDITPSTQMAKNDTGLLANDGLHPSGKEYFIWANLLAPLVGDVLR